MASAVMMSDEEIRRKLKEQNINIPLTDSTRKILIEKITKPAERKKSPTRSSTSKPSRKTISHFSSGEDETESEDDTPAHKKTKMPPPITNQRSTRRQTIGVPSRPETPEPVVSPNVAPRRSTAFRSPVPTPPLTVDVKRTSNRSSNQITSTVISPNVTMRRPQTKNAEEYDKGSDSDSTPAPAPRKLPRLADLQKAEIDREVNDLMSSSNFLSRLSTVTSYLKGEGDQEDAANRDVLMSYRKPAVSADTSPSPFVSDFTRSISRRQPSGSFSSATGTKSYQPDSSVNDDYSLSTTRSSVNGTFASSSRDSFTADGGNMWSSTHLVSMFLVLVAVVFFIVLGVVYVNMHGSEVVSYDSANARNKIPFCSNAENPPDMCVTNEQLKGATRLLNLVKPELERRAVMEVCGPPLRDGTYVSALMTEKVLVDWLSDVHNIRPTQSSVDLRALRLLLRHNSHWGVSVKSALPHASPSVSDEEERMLVDNGSLVIPSVSLPFACHVKRKLTAIITTTIVILSLGGLVFGIRNGTGWWLVRREQQRQRLYALVQRILEVLQDASERGAQYVAINHVRDQLIAPSDRDGMSGQWWKAVQFLDQNESRVRREAQLISGEECPVWRWLPAHTSSSPGTEQQDGGVRNKQWHGQAFGTDPGAQNGAPNSPTPCLKLRHMFDEREYGDEWVRKVQDALLRKIGERAQVLHLHVDQTSAEGCVYMKLATKEDAGLAYRALHGWWFDSHLVTVKYLRLERYHERFPDAVNAKVPLRASTGSDEVDD